MSAIALRKTVRQPLPELHNPQQNHLLRALPAAEAERLFSKLELVPMVLGQVLYESGSKLRHVYFPDDVDRVAALCDGGRRFR